MPGKIKTEEVQNQVSIETNKFEKQAAFCRALN